MLGNGLAATSLTWLGHSALLNGSGEPSRDKPRVRVRAGVSRVSAHIVGGGYTGLAGVRVRWVVLGWGWLVFRGWDALG